MRERAYHWMCACIQLYLKAAHPKRFLFLPYTGLSWAYVIGKQEKRNTGKKNSSPIQIPPSYCFHPASVCPSAALPHCTPPSQSCLLFFHVWPEELLSLGTPSGQRDGETALLVSQFPTHCSPGPLTTWCLEWQSVLKRKIILQ